MLLLPFVYWDLVFFFFLPQVLRTHVMVRVGGGWDTLEHYLDKHDPCRCAAFGEVTSYSSSAPFRKNNLIVVSWFWQHSWRFEDERQITADVQSKHLTDIHVNLTSVISHFFEFCLLCLKLKPAQNYIQPGNVGGQHDASLYLKMCSHSESIIGTLLMTNFPDVSKEV